MDQKTGREVPGSTSVSAILSSCMYECSYVYVCMNAHADVRSEANIRCLSFSALFFETGFHTEPVAHALMGLAGQQAPRSSCLHSAGIMGVCCYTNFLM